MYLIEDTQMIKHISMFLLLFTLFACNKNKQKDIEPVETGTTIQEEVLPIGFIEKENCGWSIGEKACDFNLLDKNDDPWQLSKHAGDLILLDLSAMWCGPCQAAAQTVQATEDEYRAQGFHYVTILLADSQNSDVDREEVDSWSQIFGIISPAVLQGNRELLSSSGISYGFPVSSWPTFILIDRNGHVAAGIYGFNEEYIKQIIESNL